jgi:hypothetical protein
MPFDATGLYVPTSGAETAFPGQVIASATWNAINTDYANALTDLARYAGLEYVIDGGGQPLTAGLMGFLRIPFACTIQSVSLFADKVGTCVVDIWMVPFASFPPSVANSITAAALPTITASQSSQDTTLTGWTKTIAQGNVLAFNLNSNNGVITKLTVALFAARN